MDELRKIKKTYGENFMKLCRSLFPTLLETEGRLYEILSTSFSANSRTLYEDIVNNYLEEEFKNYIYSKIDVESPDKKIVVEKTPYELLNEAGYDLYECKSEDEIQSFKKYYKEGEELCTFKGGRLNRCVVFWAVKKDAEDIKREDFKKPKREDEYGTSVMGIQFERTGRCTVSIKNRYNHTVNNPDATYGNDLDQIIPKLTKSFSNLLQKEYGLELDSSNIEKFEIPNYVVASDGKYYKFNMEINGNYYCPGNIMIKNSEPQKLENPESQILMDYFILDTKNKTMKVCDPSIEDSFVDDFQDLSEAEIQVEKNKDKQDGSRIITIKRPQRELAIIEIDKDNQIIGYTNNDLKEVGNNFLSENKGVTKLNLENLEEVGDNFFHINEKMEEVKLPNLKRAGREFMHWNKRVTKLNLENLEEVGDNFFHINEKMEEVKLPNLKRTGRSFMYCNKGVTKLDLENLEEVGDDFFHDNEKMEKVNLLNLKKSGYYFLKNIKKINSKDIAQLDKANELTTSEIGIARENYTRNKKFI